MHSLILGYNYNIMGRVLSSGGGGGKLLPQNVQLPPPKYFDCLIVAILSKILVECYMEAAKSVQCACMR